MTPHNNWGPSLKLKVDIKICHQKMKIENFKGVKQALIFSRNWKSGALATAEAQGSLFLQRPIEL